MLVCYFTRLQNFHKLSPAFLMLVTLFRLLSHLPLSFLHAIGSVLGVCVYWCAPTYRRRLRANIRAAGHDAHLRQAIREAGKSIAELPFVWFANRTRLEKVTTFEHWELIEKTLAEGKGLIFLTPHLGCFEVTAQMVATRMPITVLYRPPRKDALKPLIEGARARSNLLLAPATLAGVRILLKALKRGEAIGMLPDQVPQRGEGVWANFFGKPAYTMTLPGKLHQMSEAPILIAYGERTHGGFAVRVSRVDQPITGSAEEQASAINQAMESLISQCPEQYFWSYNRYKVPAGVIPSQERT